ncbi:MAG: fumarylacetoacetate hydrolase family protein [Planctomycetota bacterium]|jgi:2-keto-4-pentenoate hydratase/2-oxohepta-3-ene-1,7-dioic acid hydratase in catechol pathway|nr:fumarylacetoacetate hydrolase family protein [Planctomycetota bacterium]
MKLVRYQDASGRISYGRRHDDGRITQIDGDILASFTDTGIEAVVSKVLAPIVPSDILCIGLNYRKHAVEGNQAIPTFPVVFMKNLGALQNPGDPIILPRRLRSDEVDYECELAVVIGRECYNVSKANALEYVLGYTCANDVSARDWQIRMGGSQWCRGKTFATFCPLGPWIVTRDEIPNPNSLPIKTVLNGQTMQDWNTNDMIFDIPTLIEFLSGSTRLLPGTVILTGTPHGVGAARKPPVFLKQGDDVSIEIGSIGSLNNPVIEET